MQYTNLPPKDMSATEKYFNDYFSTKGNVDANVYEALLTFFEKQTKNVDAAKIIMSGLVQTSIQKNLSLRDLADQFKKMSQEDIDRYVITILNMTRKNSSLLGFKNNIKSNQYILRSILP